MGFRRFSVSDYSPMQLLSSGINLFVAGVSDNKIMLYLRQRFCDEALQKNEIIIVAFLCMKVCKD